MSDGTRDQIQQRLLSLTQQFMQELQPGRLSRLNLDLRTRLDKDLGLDSLSRVELLLRINRDFGIELGESALTEAESCGDLLELVVKAEPAPLQQRTTVRVTADSNGRMLQAPDHADTLNEVLTWHAEQHGDNLHCLLYEEEDQEPLRLSYQTLYDGAFGIAQGLLAAGIGPNRHVALMLPTGRDYLYCFFGILLAGAVPVPIYPPTRPSQLEDHLLRHSRLLDNAKVSLLITIPAAMRPAQLLKAQVPSLTRIATAENLSAPSLHALLPQRSTDDVAFLQYTSGSTGQPKGVILTHRHLLANIRAMGAMTDPTPDDVFVSWLPLYHDMGLIGAWFGSLYYGIPLVLMSPLAFLTNPLRWLRMIHEHRGTLSAAPNFAYELVLKNVQDEDLQDLDLSCWRAALNGAEPVSPRTLRRFAERLAPAGFDPDALKPVYGLAEAAVGLAFPPISRGPVIDRIDRQSLTRNGTAEPAAENTDDIIELPACGQPLPGYEIRIVDDKGRELPERQQGRVQFQGPSATDGYFDNPEATKELCDGPWRDTGDLGYLAGGDLYLSARVKDMIIRGGRNLYPYELESAVGQLEGIRAGCVAAFGSRHHSKDGERLIVVAEVRNQNEAEHSRLVSQIESLGSDLLGLPPDDVVLVPPHSVLKTSSGKIRRTAMRDLYERNELGKGPAPVVVQLTRVFARAGFAQLRQLRQRLGTALHAGWLYLLAALIVPPVWLLLLPLRLRLGWPLVRTAARVYLRISGLPVTAKGFEHQPQSPCVVIANHASYLDGLLLMANLRHPVSFIAKGELRGQWFAGLLLKRIGTLFVDRFDLQAGTESAGQIIDKLRTDSVMFFPEGTFVRQPGLLPFRMGAFIAAARAGVPVVPVSINGTRSALRAGQWLPYRAPLSLIMHQTIEPQGDDFDAAVKLRDAARSAILEDLDEPDLGDTVSPVAELAEATNNQQRTP
jgi:1-acyl-sn-glycerol-3-phosphate acyltransferase